MTNNAQLFARLQDSRSLPSLPQVLLQVIALEEQEDFDIKELVKVIAQDPAISAKALRLVNSAYFNLEGKFTSIERAVLYLGADAVKNIAVTASVHHVFNGIKQNGSFSMDRFWWDSFSCAIYSKRIAQQIKYTNVEEAYISGLLLNLGKLVLYTNFPREYKDILSQLANQTDCCDLERQQIGLTHCEAGAWLIKHWKLNSFMADAVLYHHEPVARVKNGFPLVKIASLAHTLSKSTSPDSSLLAFGQELLGLTSEQMQSITSGAQEEIEKIAASLDLPIQTSTDKEDVQEETKTEALDKHSLRLVSKVQESSLLTSFLESLLRSKDQESILKATEQALNILLEIDTIVFFLQDSPAQTLFGCTSSQNRYQELVQDLVLSDTADSSLLARAISEQKIINPHARSATSELGLADLQLLDLMGQKGMAYIPMVAGEISIGVIVLGIKEAKLLDNTRILRLIANQTAMSIHLLDIKEKQAKKIHDERLAATALAAAKIAHEINNPLAIIKNYFKIFELKFTQSATLKEDLKILDDEINRISTIVQQLYHFTPSDKQEWKEIDLNDLLTDVTKILARSILYTSKTQIHFSPGTNLPLIKAPADDIKQIVINLIKNSAEALQEGGNIYVETHQKETPHSILTDNRAARFQDRIVITVRDDGPGIAEEIADSLFDPFVSTKTSTTATGNAGLGLSIVQNIVTQLHGTISCESSRENGTSFTIELPIHFS
ncbi:MAG: putative signal transduction [Desulfobulbaceae bacterium]|nr:MAG: putative signal transduction [Desulfobulbaceae bacterium]